MPNQRSTSRYIGRWFSPYTHYTSWTLTASSWSPLRSLKNSNSKPKMDHCCNYCFDTEEKFVATSERLQSWLRDEFFKSVSHLNRSLSKLRNDEIFEAITKIFKSGYWNDCPRISRGMYMDVMKLCQLVDSLEYIVKERYTRMHEDFSHRYDSEDSKRRVESYRLFSEVFRRIIDSRIIDITDNMKESCRRSYDHIQIILVCLNAMSSAGMDPYPMGAPQDFSPVAKLDGALKEKVLAGTSTPFNKLCTICINPLSDDYTIFDNCQHTFCYTCIEGYFQSQSNRCCPNCREEVGSWTSTGLVKLLPNFCCLQTSWELFFNRKNYSWQAYSFRNKKNMI